MLYHKKHIFENTTITRHQLHFNKQIDI